MYSLLNRLDWETLFSSRGGKSDTEGAAEIEPTAAIVFKDGDTILLFVLLFSRRVTIT